MINNKFLLPAGYLPPLAPISIFQYYEDLRSGKYSHTAPIASGFEYNFMVKQDPEMVNRSPIGGKIVGVHGPWTQMSRSPKLEWWILSRLVFQPEVDKNLFSSAKKTVDFAKAIGAKYIVLHSIDLDPQHPEEFANDVFAYAKKEKIMVFLECDMKFNNTPPWIYNHLTLYEKFRHPIVFDSATVEINGENLLDEWEKVKNYVGHIHLNEFQPKLRMDQGIMRSAHYAELLRRIHNAKYNGYFDFEIGPVQNQFDKLITAGYLGFSLMGLNKFFPMAPKLYSRIAQKNLYESILFVRKYL